MRVQGVIHELGVDLFLFLSLIPGKFLAAFLSCLDRSAERRRRERKKSRRSSNIRTCIRPVFPKTNVHHLQSEERGQKLESASSLPPFKSPALSVSILQSDTW